ncbi:hypothetical protein GCK72_009127 [Caenorhabditis remanei]|uniref:Uncharacterized protein n=1 Tax=Caenorhabditis remanei TaxID=31234 RepID=A0A6A5H230_CAERE|nr:hypothetical protein GCK72_009127 [Caenorhabditis remanei]KAF1760876.1 hypothetical protein GCK72_009127 [Caenorhabditis remanei]
MNILALFIFCLLAITSPILAEDTRGTRCTSDEQCRKVAICVAGWCIIEQGINRHGKGGPRDSFRGFYQKDLGQD